MTWNPGVTCCRQTRPIRLSVTVSEASCAASEIRKASFSMLTRASASAAAEAPATRKTTDSVQLSANLMQVLLSYRARCPAGNARIRLSRHAACRFVSARHGDSGRPFSSVLLMR